MSVRLERRERVRWWSSVAIAVASVVVALLGVGVFLRLTGYAAFATITDTLKNGFFGDYSITDTLAYASPLILTGLAAAVAFRVNLFNIGGEGQFYVGALGASWAAFMFAENIAHPFDWVAMLACGALFGAAWIAIPALGRIRWGASEIVSTLLLNYVALKLLEYLVTGRKTMFRDPESPTFPQGRPIADNTMLPTFGDYKVGLALIVAVLIALGVWWVLARTRFGYDVSVIADSREAARYAGISWSRRAWAVMLMSGALAGIGGAIEVAGRAGYTDADNLSPASLGYAGIVVAALARYNPASVIVSAIVLAGLKSGGEQVQLGDAHVPKSVGLLLQGAVLLAAIGGEVFRRNRVVVHRGSWSWGDLARSLGFVNAVDLVEADGSARPGAHVSAVASVAVDDEGLELTAAERAELNADLRSGRL